MRTATMMLTTVLVLGSASVAAAECAWVLWSAGTYTVGGHTTTTWTILDAFVGKDQCAPVRDQTWELKIRTWRGYEIVSHVKTYPDEHSFQAFFKEEQPQVGQSYSIRFVCIPDTIDPREKKE